MVAENCNQLKSQPVRTKKPLAKSRSMEKTATLDDIYENSTAVTDVEGKDADMKERTDAVETTGVKTESQDDDDTEDPLS